MSGDGGEGPTSGSFEFRLIALERAVAKIDDRLEIIGNSVVRIETKLDHKASSEDLAAIKGRVDSLPTTWQMITLVFGILGGAFVIVRFGLPHGP